MRLIDADAAIEAIANCSIYGADEIKTQCEKIIYEENGWLGGLKDAIEAVEDMPTEVKIIRCRDCEHRELDDDLDGFDWCNAWHEPTREEGFCHLARMVTDV